MHVRRRRLDTEGVQFCGNRLCEGIGDTHGRSEDGRSAGSMQTAERRSALVGARYSSFPPS
jgi:hypothetical protein